MSIAPMELAPLEPPALKRLDDDAASLKASIEALAVRDHDSYALAVDYDRMCASAISAVEAEMKDPKAKADAAHKAVCAMEKRRTVPLKALRETIKGKLLEYNQEQERIRDAEQKRLDDLARAEAEKQRQIELAEAKRIADAAKAEAEAAKAAGDAERAKRLAEEAKEARAMTRELKAAPIQYEAPVAADTRPAVAGSVRSTTYKGEVMELGEFLAWVASSPDRFHYVTVNQAQVNNFARNYGKAKPTMHLPMLGVEIKAETNISTKTKGF